MNTQINNMELLRQWVVEHKGTHEQKKQLVKELGSKINKSVNVLYRGNSTNNPITYAYLLNFIQKSLNTPRSFTTNKKIAFNFATRSKKNPIVLRLNVSNLNINTVNVQSYKNHYPRNSIFSTFAILEKEHLMETANNFNIEITGITKNVPSPSNSTKRIVVVDIALKPKNKQPGLQNLPPEAKNIIYTALRPENIKSLRLSCKRMSQNAIKDIYTRDFEIELQPHHIHLIAQDEFSKNKLFLNTIKNISSGISGIVSGVLGFQYVQSYDIIDPNFFQHIALKLGLLKQVSTSEYAFVTGAAAVTGYLACVTGVNMYTYIAKKVADNKVSIKFMKIQKEAYKKHINEVMNKSPLMQKTKRQRLS